MIEAFRRLVIVAMVAIFSACVSAGVQAQAAAPTQTPAPVQYADLGDFKLQNSQSIRGMRLAYRTLGALNADKSNVVLWPTWLGGTTEELLQFIGPGRVVETPKYFVVLVDAIGNGVSTSPSNSKLQPRMKFPEFTIRDMVESEHKLLTDVLHVNHIHAVMGISMGGMQTFEWIEAYPDFMDVAVPIVGSPQSTSYDKLLWTSQIDALKYDPEWKDGNGTKPMTAGFGVFAEIGSMNLTTPTYRVEMTKTEDFGSFLTKTKADEKGDALTACDSIRQREAIMSLDIPKEFGVTFDDSAKRVHAKLFVIVSPEDHMVNPTPAIAFAKVIGVPVLKMDTPCGHESPDCVSVGPAVGAFLADPSSAKSQTLVGTSK